MSYTYTDREGDSLRIESDTTEPGSAYISSEPGAFVPAADLPKIVAELYEAAGQESPIILPGLDWRGNDRTAFVFNGVSAVRTGKTINILGRNWDATTARGVARVLAEMADAADNEPDPRQVAELAEVVRELAARDVLTTDDNGGAVARAILRAGYARGDA